MEGLAIGGILPAPLIIFSTFVGYLAGGLVGALVITLGIFIPAFVFPIFLQASSSPLPKIRACINSSSGSRPAWSG